MCLTLVGSLRFIEALAVCIENLRALVHHAWSCDVNRGTMHVKGPMVCMSDAMIAQNSREHAFIFLVVSKENGSGLLDMFATG